MAWIGLEAVKWYKNRNSEGMVYKVSMRSNQYVDVSQIATFFGGGGHVRAAGCTMQGSMHDVVNNLTEHIEKQILAKRQEEKGNN